LRVSCRPAGLHKNYVTTKCIDTAFKKLYIINVSKTNNQPRRRKMKNLSFDEVRELASINPKKALRVHFSMSDDEPTEYYADQVIPAMLEESRRMVEDGGYGVETIEQAMEKLEQITYICSEEDYQEEQSEE
jgi:hypothetical protein